MKEDLSTVCANASTILSSVITACSTYMYQCTVAVTESAHDLLQHGQTTTLWTHRRSILQVLISKYPEDSKG